MPAAKRPLGDIARAMSSAKLARSGGVAAQVGAMFAEPLAKRAVAIVNSDDGRRWIAEHAPKSSGKALEHRITATIAQTEAMADRPGQTPEQTRRARAWHKRALQLRDRLGLAIAKDQKKTHRAAIETDLGALHAEIDRSLQAED